MPRTVVPDATRREIAVLLLGEDRPSDHVLAEQYDIPRAIIGRIRRAIGVAGIPAPKRVRHTSVAPDVRDEMRRAYRAGEPVPAIGKRLGWSTQTVYHHVTDLVAERKAQRATRTAQMARERAPRRVPSRDLTDAEKAAIRRMRVEERLTLKVIATRYPGVPWTRIATICKDLRAPPLMASQGPPQRMRAGRIPMATRRAVVRDRDAGMSWKDLVRKHGVSERMARIIVERRALIPPSSTTGPVGRRRTNRPAIRLTPQLHAAITTLWLDGLESAEIADRLHAPRETVKAFAQKLKARGGWFSSVYVRVCLRCRQSLTAQRRHTQFHRRCAQALNGRQRRALRHHTEAVSHDA